MADIDIKRAHGMTTEQARQVAEKLVAVLKSKFEIAHHWEGDTLKFERSGVHGQLAITPSDMHLTAKLGLMLKPLKGRIEQEAVSALDRLLR
jgi:putative polyhydroxyalkanoate system protein